MPYIKDENEVLADAVTLHHHPIDTLDIISDEIDQLIELGDTDSERFKELVQIKLEYTN